MKFISFAVLLLSSFNLYANSLALNSAQSFKENLISNCGIDKHYKILRYNTDNEQGYILKYQLEENFHLLKSKKCQNTIKSSMLSYNTMREDLKNNQKPLSLTDKDNVVTFSYVFVLSAQLKLKLSRITEFSKTNKVDGFN